MELKPGYKYTEAGVIPEDWDLVPLESVTPQNVKNGIVDGPFGSNLKTIHYRSSGIPIITSGYVTEGKFQADIYLYVDRKKFNDEKRSAVSPGDIVMAKIGERCGASAILPDTHEMGILSGNALKISVDPRRHSTFYVWQVLWYLYSSGGIDLLRTVGAQPAISMANLKKHKILLPPTKAEQEAIAEALSDADALIESLDQLLAKKRNFKQGAMQELLTGKKRLQGFSGKWEVKTIGGFTDCTAGGTPSTSVPAYWGGSIRWMSSGELHSKFVIEVEGRITEQGLRNSSTKMIPKKCVLIGLAGQGRTRGTVAMNLVELCTNQSIAVIFPSPSVVPEYLYYNLDARYVELRGLSTGDGGRGGLNLTIIRSLFVPLPEVPEQTAIATVLSDMDAEISTLEEKLGKARQIKQGMMQELLAGRIRLI